MRQLTIKNKIIIGCLLCILVFIIIVAIINLVVNNKKVVLYNFDQLDSSLSGTNIDTLEKKLWNIIIDGGSFDKKNTVKALVRPNSYEEKNIQDGISYKFMIDIDEYKMTYLVKFTILNNSGFYEAPTIGCVPPNQMKYADSVCRGTKISSISAALGEFLPHDLKTDDGRTINMDIGYSGEDGYYLKVWAGACNGEKVEEEVLSKVNEWIELLGYDPSQFKIAVETYCEVSITEDNNYVF